MAEPSTRRNAVVIAPTPYRTGFGRPTTNGQRRSNVHGLFSVRNMFFLAEEYWPLSEATGPFRNRVGPFSVSNRTDVDCGIWYGSHGERRSCLFGRYWKRTPVYSARASS